MVTWDDDSTYLKCRLLFLHGVFKKLEYRGQQEQIIWICSFNCAKYKVQLF